MINIHCKIFEHIHLDEFTHSQYFYFKKQNNIL